VVRTPDGTVVMDSTGRLAGRGAYLCADGSCWRLALDKGTLQRALEVPLPETLKEQLRAGAPGGPTAVGQSSVRQEPAMSATIDVNESAGAASLQASAHPARPAGKRKEFGGEAIGQE
jgi:hypothetical protein